MSEHDQDQKTEEATPKQKERFREKGEVARSQDLASVVSIAGGTGAVVFAWSLIATALVTFAVSMLGRLDMHHNTSFFLLKAIKTVVTVIAPVGIVGLLLGLAAQIAQVGWNFSFKPMTPDPKKFNPFPKLKSMLFSGATVIELLKSVVKVTVIGILAFRVLWEEVKNNGRLVGLKPTEIIEKLGQIGLRIVLTVVLALAAIAVLDVLIERYRHKRKMMMTKDEVKREHKDTDGDPLVKGRIRGKQREMARSRMIQDVSNADVVVVNPTHYSVAIKYDMAVHSAPIILASGVDKMAARIRSEARHYNVPVVSDPPLARALYTKGKIGQSIPGELFSAVASLLAWVYNVTGRM